jgi:hypothetical protein
MIRLDTASLTDAPRASIWLFATFRVDTAWLDCPRLIGVDDALTLAAAGCAKAEVPLYRCRR